MLREGAEIFFLREHDSVEGVDQQEQPRLDVIGCGVREQSVDVGGVRDHV